MRKNIFCLFLLILLAISAEAQFFTPEGGNLDAVFGEVDGKVKIFLKDAVTAEVIEGADVIIDNKSYESDHNGSVTFPLSMIEDIDDGVLVMEVKKSGYIRLKTDLKILTGSLWVNTYYLSKNIPLEKVRFVLQWGNTPRDLDLHLLSDDFHISYRDMRNIPNLANLDRDDIDGEGPETITLDRVDSSKKYRVFVHNYSNEKSFDDKGMVYIYANGELKKIQYLHKTKDREIDILEIINKEILFK